MKEEEEIFEIAVDINHGLEPLTFNISPFEDTRTPENVLNFKVMRDKKTIAVLRPDADHCWKLLEGNMDQEQVDAIGAAIDGHYA
jgi:hypothetical protein